MRAMRRWEEVLIKKIYLLIFIFLFINNSISVSQIDDTLTEDSLRSELQDSISKCKDYLDKKIKVSKQERDNLVRLLSQMLLWNHSIFDDDRLPPVQDKNKRFITLAYYDFYTVKHALMDDPRYPTIFREFLDKPYSLRFANVLCRENLSQEDLFKMASTDKIPIEFKVNSTDCTGFLEDRALQRKLAQKYLLNLDYLKQRWWSVFLDQVLEVTSDVEILEEAIKLRQERYSRDLEEGGNAGWLDALNSDIDSLQYCLRMLEYRNLDKDTLVKKIERIRDRPWYNDEIGNQIEKYFIPSKDFLLLKKARTYFESPFTQESYEPPKDTIEKELSLWPKILLQDFIRTDYNNPPSDSLVSLARHWNIRWHQSSRQFDMNLVYSFSAGVFLPKLHTVVIFPIKRFNKSMVFGGLSLMINQMDIMPVDMLELLKIISAFKEKDDYYNYFSTHILESIVMMIDPSKASYGAINHEVTHAIFNFENIDRISILDPNYIYSMTKQAFDGIGASFTFSQDRLESVRDMMESYYAEETLEKIKKEFSSISPSTSNSAESTLGKLTRDQQTEIKQILDKYSLGNVYGIYYYEEDKEKTEGFQKFFHNNIEQVKAEVSERLVLRKFPDISEGKREEIINFIMNLFMTKEIIVRKPNASCGKQCTPQPSSRDLKLKIKDYDIFITVMCFSSEKDCQIYIGIDETAFYLEYKYGLTSDELDMIVNFIAKKNILSGAYKEIAARLVHGLLNLEGLAKDEYNYYKLTQEELAMFEKFEYKGQKLFKDHVAKYRLALEINNSRLDPVQKEEMINTLRYGGEVFWLGIPHVFPLSDIKIKGKIPYCSIEAFRTMIMN